MLGISYGELFLIIGATAALVGPKDLPIIARAAGRLAGRAVGYIQLARGQFDNVMQQSQARQVHKELQETMAQLDAIRYEIRGLSLMNPGPTTRRLLENSPEPTSHSNEDNAVHQRQEQQKAKNVVIQDQSFQASGSINMHSQAITFAKLAESAAKNAGPLMSNTEMEKLNNETGLLAVLPVSAESAGMLPNHKGWTGCKRGSDIVLEAILEAEVAHNAKDFFSQPQNQILMDKEDPQGGSK